MCSFFQRHPFRFLLNSQNTIFLTYVCEENCSLQDWRLRNIKEQNWCQHLRSSMEASWPCPFLQCDCFQTYIWCFCHSQGINIHSKPRHQTERDEEQVRITQMLHKKPQMHKQRSTATEEPPWNGQRWGGDDYMSFIRASIYKSENINSAKISTSNIISLWLNTPANAIQLRRRKSLRGCEDGCSHNSEDL